MLTLRGLVSHRGELSLLGVPQVQIFCPLFEAAAGWHDRNLLKIVIRDSAERAVGHFYVASDMPREVAWGVVVYFAVANPRVITEAPILGLRDRGNGRCA
jgi:hypothetical protein